jgi:hypothetical protein
MTLKEKLNDSIITNINIVESENRMFYDYNHLELAEFFEVIADEFAIRFAEWLLIIYNEDIIYDAYTKEELLEIYKKENEL